MSTQLLQSLLFVTATATCLASTSVRAESLTILLTNDDGYGSYGNTALKQALEGAGHNVFVSTPIADQSGKSGAINTASGAPVQFTTHVQGREWAVDGTPVDAVSAGLFGLMPTVSQ